MIGELDGNTAFANLEKREVRDVTVDEYLHVKVMLLGLSIVATDASLLIMLLPPFKLR